MSISKEDANLKSTLNAHMAILVGAMFILALFIPNIS
ncbi:Uncharacterised protein [Zhongshania aliphaticivorans]|uniref:Uncharacterized protein n=1 Tax=Zhongshania aliphaticivorans TaxID=1470434 RepID=A0A5S9PPF0_9GAMM|nr:Uncharacterised protein [Zhongshania aliphaticivorans]CAA0106569.1 Uncharacterised protein [Zhongshania aliphaticivorans]